MDARQLGQTVAVELWPSGAMPVFTTVTTVPGGYAMPPMVTTVPPGMVVMLGPVMATGDIVTGPAGGAARGRRVAAGACGCGAARRAAHKRRGEK